MLILVAMSGKSVQASPPQGAAARHLRQIRTDKAGPNCSSVVRAAAGLVEPDGVNLDVRFSCILADIRFRVPAMIIASIRYDEQRLLCVVCSFHLAQAQINSVEQSRFSMRRSKHQMILQFFDAPGERTRELRAVVEIDQEKFVLRIRGAEELHRRQPRFFNLVGHAAAHIENHADGNRHVFAGEAHNFLLAVVFEYAGNFPARAL